MCTFMKSKKLESIPWFAAHPAAYAIFLATGAMLLTIIIEAFIETIGSGFAAMITQGSASRENIENLGLISTAISLGSYILVLLLYRFIFRKDLHQFFHAKKLGTGILLGWSSLIIDAFTLVVGVLNHNSYGNPAVAFLLGVTPGISEEILYRIIPLSFAMKSEKREQLAFPVIVFTSLIFGLRHGMNIFYGADPVTTLFQVLYATGTGFLFAAIYLKNGNIWITMFLHSLTDVVYFLGSDAQNGGGVLSQGTTLSDAVILIIYAILYFSNAFFILRKSKHIGISDIWSELWGVSTRDTKES